MGKELITSILKSNLIIGYDELKKTVQLVEKDKSAKTKQIIVGGIPDECVIIRLNDREKITNIIDGSIKGINKSCDYIIILLDGNNLNIILCELKSDNPKGYSKQFIYTAIFCKYMIDIVNKHHLQNFKIKNICNVLFSSKNQNLKRKTSGRLNVREVEGILVKLAGVPPTIALNELI